MVIKCESSTFDSLPMVSYQRPVVSLSHEIFALEKYFDLETGVRGHWMDIDLT